MSDQETREILADIASDIDPMLGPCPSCGLSELRLEYEIEWRPLTEAAVLFNLSRREIVQSGARVVGGRVKSAVPYVTCMGCGMHADASNNPQSGDPSCGCRRRFSDPVHDFVSHSGCSLIPGVATICTGCGVWAGKRTDQCLAPLRSRSESESGDPS